MNIRKDELFVGIIAIIFLTALIALTIFGVIPSADASIIIARTV